jgi:hypothetical protein
VVLKNDEITFEQLRTLLYEQREFHNVVISPGPGSPTRAEDIGMNDFYYLPLIRYIIVSHVIPACTRKESRSYVATFDEEQCKLVLDRFEY